jgi:hypothetical protein
MEQKTFRGDFYKILELLKNKTPFAFNRFSDGELFILQNKELILDQNLIKIGQTTRSGPYVKEDFKHFDPAIHGFCRDKLMEAFKHRQNNYFKGLSCRCCTTASDFQWQLDVLKANLSDTDLTWANLLLNGNYPLFMSEMLPYFNDYKTVFICNEKADLRSLPYVVKDFRVGYNAMINDYSKIEEIKTWIAQHNISGHLFLFSASSFSKMAIHQLYEAYPNNTYIDVGTTLNAFMNMSVERQYLGDYWYEKPAPADTYKVCVW